MLSRLVPDPNLIIVDEAAGLAQAEAILAGELDGKLITLEDFRQFWCGRYPGLLATVAEVFHANPFDVLRKRVTITGRDIRWGVAMLSEAD